MYQFTRRIGSSRAGSPKSRPPRPCAQPGFLYSVTYNVANQFIRTMQWNVLPGSCDTISRPCAQHGNSDLKFQLLLWPTWMFYSVTYLKISKDSCCKYTTRNWVFGQPQEWGHQRARRGLWEGRPSWERGRALQTDHCQTCSKSDEHSEGKSGKTKTLSVWRVWRGMQAGWWWARGRGARWGSRCWSGCSPSAAASPPPPRAPPGSPCTPPPTPGRTPPGSPLQTPSPLIWNWMFKNKTKSRFKSSTPKPL